MGQEANLAGKGGCGRQAEHRAGIPALLRGHAGRSEGVGRVLWGRSAPAPSVGCAALLAALGWVLGLCSACSTDTELRVERKSAVWGGEVA